MSAPNPQVAHPKPFSETAELFSSP